MNSSQHHSRDRAEDTMNIINMQHGPLQQHSACFVSQITSWDTAFSLAENDKGQENGAPVKLFNMFKTITKSMWRGNQQGNKALFTKSLHIPMVRTRDVDT